MAVFLFVAMVIRRLINRLYIFKDKQIIGLVPQIRKGSLLFHEHDEIQAQGSARFVFLTKKWKVIEGNKSA